MILLRVMNGAKNDTASYVPSLVFNKNYPVFVQIREPILKFSHCYEEAVGVSLDFPGFNVHLFGGR